MAEHSMCQPGPARAPGRRPAGLAGLAVLPQHEVQRIALGFVDLHARAGAQVFELLARQLAVAGETRHRIHHVAIGRGIGMPARDQRLDQRHDLRQMLRWRAARGRARDAQLRGIFIHGRDVARGERIDASRRSRPRGG